MSWVQAEGITGYPANTPALELFPDAVLSDPDNSNASQLTIDLQGLRDGNREILTIGGFELELSTTVSEQSIDGGFELATDVRKIGSADGADVASISDFRLVQGITYNNTHQRPTEIRSLQFDGNDDYIAISDSDHLDLSSDFSIEAWIKPIGQVESPQ